MRNLQGFIDDLRYGNMQFARHPERYEFTEDECLIIEKMFDEIDCLHDTLKRRKRRIHALRERQRTLHDRLRVYQKFSKSLALLAQTVDVLRKGENEL